MFEDYVDYEDSKRIFLHHIDDYETNHIRKDLIEQNVEAHCLKYELHGCLNEQENLAMVMREQHPLIILNCTSDSFIEDVANCDIIVFNANSNNFEKVCVEMRKVMKKLEEMCKDPDMTKKCVILISSPMTWALTPTDTDVIDNDEDDVPSANEFLQEEDYRRRRAHKNYCKCKLLERDVIWLQKKSKHLIRTLVVCPGVVYGGENKIFHYIFKYSFYNNEVPIINGGCQTIPMIYIKDFVLIMRNIFESLPESKIRYVFAVQPTVMTLKSFTYHIYKAFNDDYCKIRFIQDIELLSYEEDLFPKSVVDILTSLDKKMALTYFKDFEFHELTEEFWLNLAQEFRNARNLHPLKIIVCGPPLVGITEQARLLSEFYQVLYVDTNKIIEQYIQFLEEKVNDSTKLLEQLDCESNEEEQLPEIDEEDREVKEDLERNITEYLKELFDLKVYIASHKNFEDQDFSTILRCLINLIRTKQYDMNQGYVIDKLPFSFNEASTIFYNTFPRSERIIEEEQEENDENKVDTVKPLKPTHVVILDAPDELLLKRAMFFTENDALIRRCLRHQLLPRLDAYREKNEGSKCLENLFYDNDLVPISINIDPDTQVENTFITIKHEIGEPFKYPLTKAEQRALDEENAAQKHREKEETCRRKEELLKSLIAEKERKLSEWTNKYERIRKRESEFHEVKTLPMRQYLEKFVLPTLTDGILKVAEVQPDDPVDFLAEYLFKCNPIGQQAPPYCTQEQRLRFENAFNDDLSSNSSLFDQINNFVWECNENNKN